MSAKNCKYTPALRNMQQENLEKKTDGESVLEQLYKWLASITREHESIAKHATPSTLNITRPHSDPGTQKRDLEKEIIDSDR